MRGGGVVTYISVYGLGFPKGPCSQIDILWPQSTQIGNTLRPKYIYLGTWTLRGFGFEVQAASMAHASSGAHAQSEKCTGRLPQGLMRQRGPISPNPPFRGHPRRTYTQHSGAWRPSVSTTFFQLHAA